MNDSHSNSGRNGDPEDWIDLLVLPDAVEVHLRIGPRMPLGLRVHSGERDRLAKRLMRSSGGRILEGGRCCAFGVDAAKQAQRLAETLGAAMRQLASKPISQRHVERALAISSAERLRWGKDGRLPQAGSAEIRRGGPVTLWTYSPVIVERLARHPEIIASWRERDRLALG